MTTFIAEQTPVTTLPGEPVPYVIEAGSGRAHVLLGEVGRALVGAEESGGAMSVMSLDGPRAERPIPLHYHDAEYEFFYCLRGQIQLWADDQSRVLAPGDFGYIPPGTLHAYQLRGHYSTFVGPIVPGGWDRFFDLTGEPFATAAFPQGPKGPPPFAKFGQAEQQFKMKYRQDAQYAEASVAADDALPDTQQPYFLRAGEGPRHELAGQLQTLLIGAEQSDGQVTMTTVELAKGPGLPTHVHERTYESLMVIEGRLRVVLDGAEQVLTRGDTASIPAGTEHSYRGDGHYTKLLTMSAPGGLERLIARAGTATEEHIFAADAGSIDLDALRSAAADLDVTLPEESNGLGTEAVYQRVREAILEGEIAPGATMSQVALAEELGISRTPLREALRMLQSEGLVDAERNRRVRVAPVSARDLEELYVMRVTLEAEAIRLAVPRMSAEGLAGLEGSIAEMTHYAQEKDYRRWTVPHQAFHRGLTAPAGERFTSVLTQLLDHAERYRRMHIGHGPSAWATKDHRGILDACKAGDRELAGRRLAEHFARTAFELIELLDPGYDPSLLRDTVGDVAR